MLQAAYVGIHKCFWNRELDSNSSWVWQKMCGSSRLDHHCELLLNLFHLISNPYAISAISDIKMIRIGSVKAHFRTHLGRVCPGIVYIDVYRSIPGDVWTTGRLCCQAAMDPVPACSWSKDRQSLPRTAQIGCLDVWRHWQGVCEVVELWCQPPGQ